MPPMAMRFLPTQEWSTCGRKIVNEFWRRCGQQFGGVGNSAILAILAIRRLRAVTNAVFADGFPFPRGPFLRKQESHFITAATPRNLGGNAAHGYEIPAYAGMVYLCRKIVDEFW